MNSMVEKFSFFSQDWRALSVRFGGCEFNTSRVLQQGVARNARQKKGPFRTQFLFWNEFDE